MAPSDKPATANTVTAPSPGQIVQPPVPAPPAQAPQTASPINISGQWRHPNGIFVFMQSGDIIEFQMFNLKQQLISQGTGKIEQNVRTLLYALNDNTSGEAVLQISADGRQMAGNYLNQATGETGSVVLVR
jgi:glycosyltransferase A (GT-A) superfamily protein (DUF2064 family)